MRRFVAFLAFLLAACSAAEFKDASGLPGEDPGETPAGEEDGEGDNPDGSAKKKPADVALGMSSNVTIQVQPSDLGAAIIGAIRGAQKSVHMTMYLLTDDSIVGALGDLKDAGKEVKVILNKTFPPNGGDNYPRYTALKDRGVDVRWAPSGYEFTHAKTVVIDAKTALIMTMNLTQTSAKTNREYIATDSDADDVADLEKIFAADYANKPINLASKLVLSPKGGNELYSARDHLEAFIASATTSLDVEVQSLSDSGIVDAIVEAHKRNVDVHVVIDAATANTTGEEGAIAKMKAAGVPLTTLSTLDIHAKSIVIDDARVFVGSQNMTLTALDRNREVGVLTDAKSEAIKVRQTIRADFDNGKAL